MTRVPYAVLFFIAGCASSPPSPAAAPPPPPPANSTAASRDLPAAAVTAPAAPAAPLTSQPSDTRGVHLASDPSPAAPVGPPSPPAAAGTNPILTFGMSSQTRDGAVQPLASGSSLRSGEKFWLDVGVNVPLYVYVVWISPDNKSEVIYPPEGAVLLSAGSPQRVPTSTSDSFQLDNVPGAERLVILATRGELGREGGDVSAAIARIRASRRWPADLLPVPKAPPHPFRATTSAPAPASGSGARRADAAEADAEHATRGVILSQGARPTDVQIAPDDSGTIVMPFVVNHLP